MYRPSIVLPAPLAARVQLASSAILEACWLVGLVGIPLLVNPSGGYAFSIYKAALFRTLVGLMVAVIVLQETLFGGFTPENWYRRLLLLLKATVAFLKTPLMAPAMALAAAYVLGTLLSISPATSLWGSPSRMDGTYTTLALIAYLMILSLEVRTPAQVNRIVWAILAGSSLVSLLGVAEWVGWSPWLLERPYDTWRVGATTGNPTALGAYLVLPIALMAGKICHLWILRTEPPRNRLALRLAGLGLLMTLHLATLLFTNARGAWLGFVVATALFFGLLFIVNRRWGLLRLAGLVFLIGILVAVGLFQRFPILGNLSELPYLSRVAEVTDVASASRRARLAIWGATSELIISHPTATPAGDSWNWARPLVGYGPETLQLAFERVYPSELRHLGTALRVDRAHNIVLDLTVTVGLLGMLAFGWLAAAYFFHAGRLLRQVKRKDEQPLLLALIAGAAGYLVTQMVGISALADQLVFWAALALVVVLAQGLGASEHIQSSQRDLPDEESEHPARSARMVRHAHHEREENPLTLSLSKGHPELRPKVESLDRVGPVEGSERDEKTGENVRLPSRSPSAGKKVFVRVTALALAVAVFVSTVKINTDLISADILTRRGADLMEQGRWKEAALSFEKALGSPPLRAFNNWYLAQAYSFQAPRAASAGEQARLLELASARIEAARALEPASAGYHQRAALIYTYWAVALDPTKYDAAVAAFAEAAAVSPKEVSIYNQWADLEARRLNYDRALELLRRSVEVDPDWAPTHYQLGTVHSTLGQADAAAAAYRRSLELCPALWQACLDLAEELVFAGRPADARPYAELYVTEQPARWEGRLLLAQVYRGLSMAVEAREQATAALALAPASGQEQVRQFLNSLR